MNLQLTYPELEHVIQKYSSQNIGIAYVDPRTVQLSYSIAKLNLRVEKVTPTTLLLSYEGGLLVEQLVKPLLRKLQYNAGELIEILPHCQLRLHLANNEGVAKVLDYVVMREVKFDEKHMVVEVESK